MDKEILFVNRNQQIAQDFLLALGELGEGINVVHNSEDAILALRVSKYKVMITETNLEGMDGTQLIKNVNRQYPNIACIVYTKRMSPGQLSFLINHLNIWRIFLRPVNNMETVAEAIRDGISHHDRRVSYDLLKNEEDDLAQKSTYMEEEIERVKTQKEWMNVQFKKGLRRSLELFQTIEKDLSSEERQMMSDAETLIIAHILGRNDKEYQSFVMLKKQLISEFRNGSRRTIDVTVPSTESVISATLMYRIDLISWLFCFRVGEIVREYQLKISITEAGVGCFKLVLQVMQLGKMTEIHGKYPSSMAFTREVSDIMEQECEEFNMELDKGMLTLSCRVKDSV